MNHYKHGIKLCSAPGQPEYCRLASLEADTDLLRSMVRKLFVELYEEKMEIGLGNVRSGDEMQLQQQFQSMPHRAQKRR